MLSKAELRDGLAGLVLIGLLLTCEVVGGDVVYVSLDGNHESPFDSWVTAATNIQEAVDGASDSALVLVNDGVYTLSQEISIPKGIRLQSVNGASAVHLSGSGVTRVLRLAHSNAVVDGFAIRDGYAAGGAGVFFDPSGSGGMLLNSVVQDNHALFDWDYPGGGGIYIDGSAEGIRTVRNTLITSNLSDFAGGGVYLKNQGLLENCTVVDNAAFQGGGVYVENGSGITVENTIIFYNTADVGDDLAVVDEYGSPTTRHSASPALSGNNNITAEPAFLDRAGGDYRLASGWDGTAVWSGLDGGTNRAWMVDAVDLTGTARIQNGIVDIGAYEGAPLDVVHAAPPQPHARFALVYGWILGAADDPPAVRVYYGQTDGGTHAAAWDAVLHLPAPRGPGEVKVWINELTPQTDYFYRFNLTNAARNVWAPSVGVFTTTASDVPESWYQHFGISPALAGVAAWADLDPMDLEGDGSSNWQEYLAGTDPTNAASVFRLLVVDGGPPVILQWQGGTLGSAAPYDIMTTTNPATGHWQRLDSRSRAAGVQTWTNPVPHAGDRLFFRIRVVPE